MDSLDLGKSERVRARRDRSRRAFPTLLGLGLVLGSIVGCQTVELPDPPEMDAIIAAYEGPTADLDTALARAMAERVFTQADSVRNTTTLNVVGGIVNSFQPDAGVAASDAGHDVPGIVVGEAVINGNGILRITHACDGWAGDPATGSLTANVLVQDSTIFQVVWGELHACRSDIGGRELEVDGRYALHFDERITPGSFDPQVLTGRFDLSVTERGRSPVEIAFDFRVLRDGVLEMRISGAGSWVIASLRSDAVAVRATSGLYLCDFAARRCAEPGGREVLW